MIFLYGCYSNIFYSYYCNIHNNNNNNNNSDNNNNLGKIAVRYHDTIWFCDTFTLVPICKGEDGWAAKKKKKITGETGLESYVEKGEVSWTSMNHHNAMTHMLGYIASVVLVTKITHDNLTNIQVQVIPLYIKTNNEIRCHAMPHSTTLLYKSCSAQGNWTVKNIKNDIKNNTTQHIILKTTQKTEMHFVSVE